jgi:TRAP-type mannitol/chloroaromatic compound transport system permease small subunit
LLPSRQIRAKGFCPNLLLSSFPYQFFSVTPLQNSGAQNEKRKEVPAMKSFQETVGAISEWSGKFVAYFIYIGIALLAIEVVLRYFWNAPTVWAHGYSQRLFGSYFILVGAYTLLKDGHVRVDVLYVRYGPRGKTILDLLNYGLLLIWSTVLLTEGWTFFLRSYRMREVDEMVLAHPVYPVKFLLIIGVLLIALHGLALFLATLKKIVRGDK